MRTIFFLFYLASPALSFAAEPFRDTIEHNINEGLIFSGSIGHLSGIANELVYDDEDNSTLSQLEWKTKNAAIFKGELRYTPAKISWLTVGANGWFTLSEGNATMTDYDWTDPEQSTWTDRSYHPNTTLSYANEVGVNATIWVLKQEQYQLGVLAGYKTTVFDWFAKGGEFNYEQGTHIGNFPNIKLITYKQRLNTPYIGLSGAYEFSPLSLSTNVLYSRWVSIHDRDHHILNDQIFTNRIKKAQYFSVEMEMAYHMTKKSDINVGVNYNHYLTRQKGTTDVYDISTGQTEHSPSGVSGVKNRFIIASLGFRYRF